jgi:hypothetical protein
MASRNMWGEKCQEHLRTEKTARQRGGLKRNFRSNLGGFAGKNSNQSGNRISHN